MEAAMANRGQIHPGEIVTIIAGHFMLGNRRKVIKIHHSGVLAYLEPVAGERVEKLYFHIKYLEHAR